MEAASPEAVASAVGARIRAIRIERGLSLERFSKISGVSRAMLSQIELGQSTPTIKLLWKVASALDLPFASLLPVSEQSDPVVLRARQAKTLTSADGSFRSRALFPPGRSRNAELYMLTLAPRAREDAEAHAPRTMENLVVARGKLRVTIPRGSFDLQSGDAILFEADVPHQYENVADSETQAFLVMTYGAEKSSRSAD